MSPQQQIAHYRILSKLGEGGMGEVWRATDTKLNRDVAIKVLPDAFANDADRLARFTREAQVLASLNHPNIAAIYGVEERALVMELVEGGEPRGPMEEAEALPIVQQLIDALEYAHERGVVHRDLKPANIKLTPEGKVKVLDFGLAKAISDEKVGADPTSSPTLTMRATLAGTIMGTAAYMAPEQARGQNVDKRADIWAFGAVMYELLVGRQLFQGASVSDTLASVLRQEIDLTVVPARFRRLLNACLERDAKRRLRDIGDAGRLLLETPVAAVVTPRRGVPLWGLAVLAVAAVAAGWIAWRSMGSVSRPLMRFNVDLGPDAVAGARTTATLSPDGTRLVYVLHNSQSVVQLATRTLDQATPTVLAGTEDASDPFFSPDGKWIGFFSAGKMKKISVLGGAAVPIANAPAPRGASWGEDGNIVYTPELTTGLVRVSEAGGTPHKLTDPRKSREISHRWPQILPGGQKILFTGTTTAADYEDATLQVLSLKTGYIAQVHRGGYFGRYLPSGHLLYVHLGTLFAAPFDPGSLTVRGTPAPVQDGIASNPVAGSGQFDFSRPGTLVYVSGIGQSRASISLTDASGNVKPLFAGARQYRTPRFSPDGKRMAYAMAQEGTGELWVYDFERQTSTQLTFGGHIGLSLSWAPDGKHIALAASGGSQEGYGIWWIRSDGAGEPQVLLKGMAAGVIPTSFSPDGKRLVYSDTSGQGGSDIWILPIDTSEPNRPKAGTPEPLLRSAAYETGAEISPDGRWIAYTSDESGTNAVYVVTFGSGTGSGKWGISMSGGKSPFWSRDGRQLYYLGADDRLMVVDCRPHVDSFDHANPRRWSDRQYVDITQGPLRILDLSPDGKHIAAVEFGGNSNPQGPVHVTFLLNFFDELRRTMP